jgi:hypothetical protein
MGAVYFAKKSFKTKITAIQYVQNKATTWKTTTFKTGKLKSHICRNTVERIRT